MTNSMSRFKFTLFSGSQDSTVVNITHLANILPKILHSCFLFGDMFDSVVKMWLTGESNTKENTLAKLLMIFCVLYSEAKVLG